MNKASFRWAFLALLASSFTGCASPMQFFAKKPQTLEEFRAEQLAKQNQIAGSRTAPTGHVEIAELLHKGHAAFQQGNLPEAQSNYYAVIQRQANHPVANHRLGVIADRQQDYQSAQRYYFTALQASPRDPNLLNDIGYSFLLQSRYGESERYLQDALRLNPTQSNAINNLGLLYAKQGQADQALAMFRRTNSEAEAQAKLARLLPSNIGAVAPPNTMLAQNPATSPNTMGPSPNGYGGQNWAGELAGATPPTGYPPNRYPPNSSNGVWTQPNSTIPNNVPPVTQAGANPLATLLADPNLPETTRNLLLQMEREGRKAAAERHARDNAERQRQELAARRLRSEEFGRPNGMNPNAQQPGDPNGWNLSAGGTPNSTPNSSGPLVVGPAASNPNPNPNPNANSNNPAAWEPPPSGATAPNGYVDLIPSTVPNGSTNFLSNSARGQVPPTSPGSPLDTMPAYPPSDVSSMPAPHNSATTTAPLPNVTPSGAIDDPARAASRMGMNAGPGTMFPITPGPTSAPTNPTSRPNNYASPNGISPTTPSNWPANSNQPVVEPALGDPPSGSFGPGSFQSSANSPAPRQQPPAQSAWQNQLPPPDFSATPNRYGFAPSTNGTPARPTGFAPNSEASRMPSPQSRSSNSSTPFGENTFLDYEREIQRQNAETNLIRQQLEAQRQLQGSESSAAFGRK
jgi:tetratricopeptide (TPR) repeat protein